MRRILLPIALFSGVSLFFCNCGDDGKKGDTRQVFRFNEVGDVTSLDPALAGSFENNWALNQLYNGLVEMDTALNVQPCIAKSWNITDDGLEYTFHLRTDIVFHDNPQFPGGKGRKVTASDFVFSFDRLFDKTISNASTLVDGIDMEFGTTTPAIKATDDSTLEIRLIKPFKPFLGILTMKYFSVVPKEVVQFYKNDFGTHPVGTGPFRLKFWKDKTSLVLEKNPNYFKYDELGVRLPHLDIVSVSFVKDPDAAFMQFMSGDLDMISGIDAINKEQVLEKDGELKRNLRDKMTLISVPFLK
ncbi:MAG TPA: ABC transporter substrate-binding protein, partial [Bacteroidia bacterium]|nr:ABC transporter substrate-binding protein [Bacteroidia bacterium]